MKLALIGNGAMGRLVAARARDEGHEVGAVVTSRESAFGVEGLAETLRGHDAAIDFSVNGAVLGNVEACARAGVPLVEGTTGWQPQEEEARRIVARHGGALIYGANFSVGVQIFYRIVARAAELFNVFAAPNFAIGAVLMMQFAAQAARFFPSAEIVELHHLEKLDAPSGTALHLRDILAAQLALDIPVASTRAGHIPGTHRVGFDSAEDQVTLTHTARSREGFAAGALVAARWIQGRRGVYEFSETMDEILGGGQRTEDG